MARIYILDDEPRLLKTIARFLETAGHEVHSALTFSDVEAELYPGCFDVVVSDILMAGHSGMDVLKTLIDRGCQEPIILMTGEPNLQTASDAVRYGAFEYICKPLSKQTLLDSVRRALRHVALVRERDRARRKEIEVLKQLAMIGESAAFLAHEIKTPITNLNHALRAVADGLKVEHKIVLEELVGRLQHLEQLLRRTLSFARPIELKPEPCRPIDLLERVRSQFDGVPGYESMRFEVVSEAEPARLLVDPQLLVDMLVNLVQNASEACEFAGRVVVSSARTDAGKIRIEVDDDGPGIPPKKRTEMFKLFHTTKANGSGMGLPICRNIVESHGGSIEAVDGRLGGACFRIELNAT